MGDVVYVGLFLACCAAALGLVRVCERLFPGGPDREDQP